jgi:hypothetical protein
MPYKTDWYIHKQVIYCEVWGEQTLEELRESNQIILNHLDQSDGRLIHIIVRDNKLEKIPVSIMQLQKVLTYSKHPQLGWVAMIGEKEKTVTENAQDFVILMLAKLTRARYIRLKTLRDALVHLQKVDTTVNWNGISSAVHLAAEVI